VQTVWLLIAYFYRDCSQLPFFTLRLGVLKTLTPAVSPPSHLFSEYRDYFSRVKWPRSDVDHSLLSNTEIRNEWSCALPSPLCLCGVDLAVVITVSTPCTSVIFVDLCAVVCSHVCGTLRSCCVVHIVVVL